MQGSGGNMEYREYNDDELQLLHLATFFDFQTVELMTGFDRETIMELMLDYENIACKHGLLGYIEVSDVLADTFENFISCNKLQRINIHDYRFHSPDYLQDLYMMLEGNEDDDTTEEELNNRSDAAFDFSNYLMKLYTVFTIGIIFPMDQEQREFWSGAVARNHDLDFNVHPDDIIRFVDDTIIFKCFIPRELDKENPNDIHRDILSRVVRKLSNNVFRDRQSPSDFAASCVERFKTGSIGQAGCSV